MIYDMNIDENRRIDYDAKMERNVKKILSGKNMLAPKHKRLESHGTYTEIKIGEKYYSIFTPNNGNRDIIIEIKPKKRYDYSFTKPDPSIRMATTLTKAKELFDKYRDFDNDEKYIEEKTDTLNNSIKSLKQSLHYQNKYNSREVINELVNNNKLEQFLKFYFDVVENKDIFIDNLFINENEYENIIDIFKSIIYVNENANENDEIEI